MTQYWRGQEWGEQPPEHHEEMCRLRRERKVAVSEARAIALAELGENWRRVPSEEEVQRREFVNAMEQM